jgi:hypothetical protein
VTGQHVHDLGTSDERRHVERLAVGARAALCAQIASELGRGP